MDKIEFSRVFKNRTRQLALNIIRLYQALPKSGEAKIIGNQLMRSATSVAANYRAACRARSDAEFFSKLSIVVEEADETEFWLSLLIDSGIKADDFTQKLHQESLEILKIVAKSRKSAKINKPKTQ